MRISNISQYLGGANNVKAISLIRGEQINYRGTVTDQSTPANPINISGFTISAVAEFYTADVTIAGSGSSATATLANFQASSKADATLTVTVDSDQSANTGQFTVTIPTDLALDTDTADLDAQTGVLLAVIYLTYNDGGTPATIRKSRIVAIIRHSG